MKKIEDLPIKPQVGWSLEEADFISKMWKMGNSASQIGEMIGRTRNSIIGKIHRLGVNRVSSNKELREIAPQAHRLKRIRPKPRPQPQPKLPSAEILSFPPRPSPEPIGGISTENAKPWLQRRAFQCCYPVSGSGADTMSCCTPTGGHTYCPGHQKVMYAPALKRKK